MTQSSYIQGGASPFPFFLFKHRGANPTKPRLSPQSGFFASDTERKMKKIKLSFLPQTSITNPIAKLIKHIKPKIVGSKKVYSRKGKSRFDSTRNLFRGGYVNDFLHTCRHRISPRNLVHIIQAGHQKSAGVRHSCRRWCLNTLNRHVRRNVRRNDGRSHSGMYYINRSVVR